MPLSIMSLFPFQNGKGGIHLLAIIYMYFFQCSEEGNALLVVVNNILCIYIYILNISPAGAGCPGKPQGSL